jgi:hypothetical protein
LRIVVPRSIIAVESKSLSDRDVTMKVRTYRTTILAAAMFLAGCTAGGPREGTARDCSITDQAAAMKASQDVLVGMGFRIDKYDIDAGFIRTIPLAGAQFFEFWRGDNADGWDAAEANLHSIQRVVEMTFTQSQGKVCMVCQAKVKRLSLPERRVIDTSSAYAMFTQSSSRLMTMKFDLSQRQEMAWVDMGSDARLAAKITDEVLARLVVAKGATK